MTYLDQFLFGFYPYLCMVSFFLGSWARFDRSQYTWRAQSSQLLRRKQLFWGSILFHVGILLLFSWVSLVHVVRAEFLRARNFEYVRAARALGLGNAKIMVKHVLPNAMVATLTFLPFILNSSITTLTSLDFLGFGLPPGSPSLGELLLQGRNNLQAPWLALTGFVVIATMLSLLVFIGEAVRDAFDPRKTFDRR